MRKRAVPVITQHSVSPKSSVHNDLKYLRDLFAMLTICMVHVYSDHEHTFSFEIIQTLGTDFSHALSFKATLIKVKP